MKTGHCLCGSVTFAYEGPENWRGHCHCDSCRRQTASPFTTFMGVGHGQWRWTGATPATYHSSPGVTRHFCATCGAPVAYETRQLPHEIHFYAALLDDPADFEPGVNFHWDEHLPWALTAAHLPKRVGAGERFGEEGAP